MRLGDRVSARCWGTKPYSRGYRLGKSRTRAELLIICLITGPVVPNPTYERVVGGGSVGETDAPVGPAERCRDRIHQIARDGVAHRIWYAVVKQG